MKMSDKKTYSNAFDELNQIVNDLEEGEVSVDELSEKVKRASELIEFCQEKLASTEEDVNSILKDLDKKE